MSTCGTEIYNIATMHNVIQNKKELKTYEVKIDHSTE